MTPASGFLEPPSWEEYINKSILQDLEKFVLNCKPVLLQGPPGIGKTSAVYVVAKKLGYKVVETNASDERNRENLKVLLARARMRGLTTKTIYLLDEADGVEDKKMLKSLVEQTRNPLVLTANEPWKLGDDILEKLEVIKVPTPRLEEVVGLVKRRVGGDLSRVSDDIRHSLISCYTGGTKYEKSDLFKLVERVFRGGTDRMDWNLSIWLMDNIPNFYEGIRMYRAYQILADADLYGAGITKYFPTPRVGGKVRYPEFLRKVVGYGVH